MSKYLKKLLFLWFLDLQNDFLTLYLVLKTVPLHTD